MKAKLTEKEGVFVAGLLLERIKPGVLASLPEATKQQTAAALYNALVDPKAGEMAGHQAEVLIRMGKPAVPTILRLLLHENPRYRRLAVEALLDVPFPDEQIEAELMKLAQRDTDPLVHESASRAMRAIKQSR